LTCRSAANPGSCLKLFAAFALASQAPAATTARKDPTCGVAAAMLQQGTLLAVCLQACVYLAVSHRYCNGTPRDGGLRSRTREWASLCTPLPTASAASPAPVLVNSVSHGIFTIDMQVQPTPMHLLQQCNPMPQSTTTPAVDSARCQVQTSQHLFQLSARMHTPSCNRGIRSKPCDTVNTTDAYRSQRVNLLELVHAHPSCS
jgi:hypothetical protein